jgi:triacylglycerol lipase
MRLRHALACALSLVALQAVAQVPPEVEAKLKAMGRTVDLPTVTALYAPALKDQSYAGSRITRDVGYGKDAAQKLDVFAPEASTDTPRPVLIFVHGGGFTNGDKHAAGSPFYDNVMLWAVHHGMVGVNLNHRMAPQNMWPAGSEDVGLAVSWVQEHIAAQGGDPQRVYLLGHSSGGALAASYVGQPQFHGPAGIGLAGVILLSANILDPTTADPGTALKAYFGDDPRRYAERSAFPGLLLTRLPMLVAVSALEPPPIERQALQLQQARCRLDRCASFVRLIGHNHLSSVFSFNTPDETVGDAILAFIRSGHTAPTLSAAL